MLTYLDATEIYPHPNNPRQELGDLTELTESIKSRGILQNLTVVPRDEGGYTVVIGHRRLAAAKLAELDVVPCTVAEMTPQEQIATMLLENIQRRDLTHLEEADGFQMLLDLGEKISTISEKTGFSESTVRRRVKLVQKLDHDILAKVQERNISFNDYELLYEIEDDEARSKVLESIGTNNFKWNVDDAITLQKRAKIMARFREIVESFAEETTRNEYTKANVIDQWIYWRPDENAIGEAEQLAADAEENEETEVYYFTANTNEIII